MKGIPLPSQPRLTGSTWSISPRVWKVVHREGSIEILPVDTPWGMICYFVVLAVAAIIGPHLLGAVCPKFVDRQLVLVFSVALALLFVAFALGLLAFYRYQQAWGPIMTISLSGQELQLPREGRSWPIANIVQWDVVVGRHLRPKGAYDKPIPLNHGLQELQVVVDEGGQLIAWPIVGATGWSDDAFLSECRHIASRMNVPLVTIDEADKRGRRWKAQEVRAHRWFQSVSRFFGVAKKSCRDCDEYGNA